MKIRSFRAFGALFFVLCLVLSASCGRKTDPLTPASPRSEPVKNITVEARDRIAFLSWPLPTSNDEGKSLNQAEIVGFRIFRAEVEQDRKKLRYKQVAEINLSKPTFAEVRDSRVYWSDSRLRYDQTYSYRIRVITARGGMSLPSEEVRVTPELSLSPPKTLNVVGGDGAISLTWARVTTKTDGAKYQGFAGYNIYRGTEPGRHGDKPINSKPLTTNSFNDSAVVNDKRYFYVVRSVDSPRRPWHESLDSPEDSAVSRDLTPPARPGELTVVPGVGRIFLTWNENKDRDLAGYHVYRSTTSGKSFVRLTDKPINRTTYSDEKVKSGVLYYYAISAVDQSGNESPRSPEKKAYAEAFR